MPKQQNNLAEMLAAFDPAQVTQLSTTLAFIANTDKELGGKDNVAHARLLAASEALADLNKTLGRYQHGND